MQSKPTAIAAGIAVLAALVLGLGTGVAAAKHRPGGNSAGAKACQKKGYLNWVRSDGSAFRNTGACVSYAAHGGRLVKRAWKSVCTDALGGSFSTGVWPFDNTLVWQCDWFGVTEDEWNHLGDVLLPFCPQPLQGGTWSSDEHGFWYCLTGMPV